MRGGTIENEGSTLFTNENVNIKMEVISFSKIFDKWNCFTKITGEERHRCKWRMGVWTSNSVSRWGRFSFGRSVWWWLVAGALDWLVWPTGWNDNLESRWSCWRLASFTPKECWIGLWRLPNGEETQWAEARLVIPRNYLLGQLIRTYFVGTRTQQWVKYPTAFSRNGIKERTKLIIWNSSLVSRWSGPNPRRLG